MLLKRLPCPYRRTLEEADEKGEKGNDDDDDATDKGKE